MNGFPAADHSTQAMFNHDLTPALEPGRACPVVRRGYTGKPEAEVELFRYPVPRFQKGAALVIWVGMLVAVEHGCDAAK